MLQLKNVSFSYNNIPALSDINLSIKQGDFVSIIGPNGSGKSTLSLLLNGLLKPSKGDVIIDALSANDVKNANEIKQKVGLLFQNPDNQIVATIVEEDVAFGPENLGLPRPEIKKRIIESLDAVGMRSFAQHEPHMLSAGQRQKVAIASVLAMKPNYLVLDEPAAYLDESSQKSLLELLGVLNKQGIAVINITHDPQQVLVSKRVIALKKGKIIFDGSTEAFLADAKAIDNIGFGRPIWLEIKEKFANKIKQLEDVDSLERLEQVLCSLK